MHQQNRPPEDVAVLECAGDHFAMGEQQGHMLAHHLHAAAEDLADVLGLPSAGERWGDIFEYLRRGSIPSVARAMGGVGALLLKPLLKEQLPYQSSRIAGLARGSNTPGRLVYLPLTLELIFGTQGSAGCTAIAVSPEASESGEPLLAKNLDSSPRRLVPYLLRRNRPSGALADLDLADPAMTGCLDGVNEAGLALSYNFRIHAGRKPRVSVPPSLLCKELLERCEDVEQALQRIRSWPHTRPCLIMLIDRQGSIATVDITDRLEIRRSQGVVVHTNHGQTLTASSSIRSRSQLGFSSEDGQASSQRRLERVRSLLQNKRVSPEDLKHALADHDGGPGDLSVCRHGPLFSTRCSVLLYPARSSLEMLRGTPCSGKYSSARLTPGSPDRS